jgi:hypothetical protein
MSGQKLKGMLKDVDDSVETLHRAFGGSGKVDDEALPDRAGHAAGKASQGTDGTHRLSQSGGLTFEQTAGGLRSEVARRKAGTTSTHDQARKRHGELVQCRADGSHAVGNDSPFDYLETVAQQRVGHHVTRCVLPQALAGRIRDGEDFGPKRHKGDVTAREIRPNCW